MYNKRTEAIPILSGNSSIAIHMIAVSEAAPPNAENDLNRKLNTINSVVLGIQAQKLKERKKERKRVDFPLVIRLTILYSFSKALKRSSDFLACLNM